VCVYIYIYIYIYQKTCCFPRQIKTSVLLPVIRYINVSFPTSHPDHIFPCFCSRRSYNSIYYNEIFQYLCFCKKKSLSKPPKPHHNTLYIKCLLDIALLTFLHEILQRILIKRNGWLEEPRNRSLTSASVCRKTTVIKRDLKFS